MERFQIGIKCFGAVAKAVTISHDRAMGQIGTSMYIIAKSLCTVFIQLWGEKGNITQMVVNG